MTRNFTQATPLGGNNRRLRGIRERLNRDVTKNGVRPRKGGAQGQPSGLSASQVQAIRDMR